MSRRKRVDFGNSQPYYSVRVDGSQSIVEMLTLMQAADPEPGWYSFAPLVHYRVGPHDWAALQWTLVGDRRELVNSPKVFYWPGDGAKDSASYVCATIQRLGDWPDAAVVRTQWVDGELHQDVIYGGSPPSLDELIMRMGR